MAAYCIEELKQEKKTLVGNGNSGKYGNQKSRKWELLKVRGVRNL